MPFMQNTQKAHFSEPNDSKLAYNVIVHSQKLVKNLTKKHHVFAPFFR